MGQTGSDPVSDSCRQGFDARSIVRIEPGAGRTVEINDSYDLTITPNRNNQLGIGH